ncbi:MAG: HAD family phosphatase [Acidimicrobiales bacterium]
MDDAGRRFDAVLFDFSGVLVDSAFDAMRALSTHPDGDAVLELLLGPYDRDTDHPWHQVERGELPIAEWLNSTQVEADRRGIAIDFGQLASWFSSLGPRPVMIDAVRELRAEGYRTAIVTNNVREVGESWRAKLPIDELFDAVIDSSEVGVRKPNPAIFALALEQLGGVAAGRAVFLDDHPGNIAGARAAGLHTVLVDDPAVAVAELRALLAGGAAPGSGSASDRHQ